MLASCLSMPGGDDMVINRGVGYSLAAWRSVLQRCSLAVGLLWQAKNHTGFLSGAAVGGYDPVGYSEGQAGGRQFGLYGRACPVQPGISRMPRTVRRSSPIPRLSRRVMAAIAPGRRAGLPRQGRSELLEDRRWQALSELDKSVQGKWEADIPGFIAAGDRNWRRSGWSDWWR